MPFFLPEIPTPRGVLAGQQAHTPGLLPSQDALFDQEAKFTASTKWGNCVAQYPIYSIALQAMHSLMPDYLAKVAVYYGPAVAE